jgi:hypothetical protein
MRTRVEGNGIRFADDRKVIPFVADSESLIGRWVCRNFPLKLYTIDSYDLPFRQVLLDSFQGPQYSVEISVISGQPILLEESELQKVAFFTTRQVTVVLLCQCDRRVVAQLQQIKCGRLLSTPPTAVPTLFS